MAQTKNDSSNKGEKDSLTPAFSSKADLDSEENHAKVDDAWSTKISLLVGGGPGILIGRMYDQPFVERTDGFVHVSTNNIGSKILASISLGISYTFTTKIFYSITPVMENGEIRYIKSAEWRLYVPRLSDSYWLVIFSFHYQVFPFKRRHIAESFMGSSLIVFFHQFCC